MPLTYHSYLKLEELLSLQKLQSPGEQDEMLFIVIHQVYELWFKEILHELDYVCRMLEDGRIEHTRHSLKRVLTILKVLVHQVDILETMTPLEFLSFRDYLQTASGFQSYQWRELEFLLGMKSSRHLDRYPEGSDIRNKLEVRLNAPSVWYYFLKYLAGGHYNIPDDALDPYSVNSADSNDTIRKVLIDIYQSKNDIAQFCELLVDLDEGIQEWRYRHVKMVERTIGAKNGTGGSSGVEYLKASLFKPIFPELWEIRSSFTK